MKLLLPLQFYGLLLPAISPAAILALNGASGVALPGSTANPANLQAGESALFTGVGTDDCGTSFDAIVTLNAKSAGATADAANAGGFLHTVGSPDSWADWTLSFITSGTSTTANPTGNPLTLGSVTSFIAKDIDSSTVNTNNTDVFGMYNNSSMTLGADLQAGGFVGTGHPTTGVTYARVDPSNSGNLSSWQGEGFTAATDTDAWATYNYPSTPQASFQFVWGVTGGSTGSVNRGMFAEIAFAKLAPVPEPSRALLLALGLAGGWLRRSR